MRFNRPVFSGLFLPLLLALIAMGSPKAATVAALRMEPTRTRVGIAKVKLEVSGLDILDGRITGDYRIEVPLAPMLNDRGTIDLPLDQRADRLLTYGGTVTGTGTSDDDGRIRPVVCTFSGDGEVNITIQTDRRKLSFHTRFETDPVPVFPTVIP